MTQDGDRRRAMSYFRYASLVTDELAAETRLAAEPLSLAPIAGETVERKELAGDASDSAGLTAALWRAAHALSPAALVAEPAVVPTGPYSAMAERELRRNEGGAGHLNRLG